MHFTIQREALLKPLQLVAGVVERRQTLPVLSNVLLVVQGQQLSLTGTDLEVELVGRVALEEPAEAGEITVPARKLMDICKSLQSDALIDIRVDEQKLLIKAGRSRFSLSTLPANDFPSVEESQGSLTFAVAQSKLRRLIERTSFAMAQQDVRYYLNGMLWVADGQQMHLVATDGHRMTLASAPLEKAVERREIILPRKTVLELSRLLSDEDDAMIDIALASNQARLTMDGLEFTSKLIEGKFPDYQRVVPKGHRNMLQVERTTLQAALQRVAILTNDKFKGVRVNLEPGLLRLTSINAEQEEAQEEIDVDYGGDVIEIGFNIAYLIDALANMPSDQIRLELLDGNSSALFTMPDEPNFKYVVMPMRI